MTLGENIRHLRAERGWTLEQLSERAGVEVGTLSALETRKSTRSKYAAKIAVALGVPLERLLAEGNDRQAIGAQSPPPPAYLPQLLTDINDLLPEQIEAHLRAISLDASENRQKWEALQKKFGLPATMPDGEVGKHILPRLAQRESLAPKTRAKRRARK